MIRPSGEAKEAFANFPSERGCGTGSNALKTGEFSLAFSAEKIR